LRFSLKQDHQAADCLGIGIPFEANPPPADQLDLDPGVDRSTTTG
jgi:hypothetical protein